MHRVGERSGKSRGGQPTPTSPFSSLRWRMLVLCDAGRASGGHCMRSPWPRLSSDSPWSTPANRILASVASPVGPPSPAPQLEAIPALDLSSECSFGESRQGAALPLGGPGDRVLPMTAKNPNHHDVCLIGRRGRLACYCLFGAYEDVVWLLSINRCVGRDGLWAMGEMGKVATSMEPSRDI